MDPGVTLAPCVPTTRATSSIGRTRRAPFVTSVAPGSPAEKAGLRLFDLVHSIGDLTLDFEERAEFQRLLRDVHGLALGAPLETKVTRFVWTEESGYTSQPLTLTITLSARPLGFDETPEAEIAPVGIRVRPATSDWLRGSRLPENLTGLVITRIENGSGALLAGLSMGDLILEVDRKPVADGAALLALLEEAASSGRGKSIFFVRRGSATSFIPVELN
ncbi:MAG: PDZ domain-containing protein [Planctomycetes bacterium]|nr:PDZ domain-containing protein [Planctomycetota bacterium]